MGKYEEAKEKVREFKQQHLLKHYDKIKDEKKKEQFLDTLLSINFKLIEESYKNVDKQVKYTDSELAPMPYTQKDKLTKKDYTRYEKLGIKLIKEEKLAVSTMAGGQGTRLGHNGPKGTYDIGLKSHKSLFALLCDSLKEAKEKYGVYVMWYIMTSDENNKQTVKFFEENNYFDYPKEKIIFFKQGKLPMVDTKGKVLISEKGEIKEAADGHGGIFESMRKTDVIKDMKKNNIEWVFIGAVDNPLVGMVDPVLMGFAAEKEMLAASKSIVKAGPTEKVGVFCKRDGKPSVIEYTEISKELSEATDEDGQLMYGESHILCNLFNIKAIDKISKRKLPYHSAFKKAKCMDENGEIVTPTEPNAYKFESFIFDAFESLKDMAILRVHREEEFAPVKNAEGVDSPETARKLYNAYLKRKSSEK